LTINQQLRTCLRDPVSEIFDAARYLDAAVSAHMSGHHKLSEELILLADMPVLRDWTESLWGSNSPYVNKREVPDSPPSLSKDQRVKTRMPTTAEKILLHDRDGYHCRFCGIPVIRMEIRNAIKKNYPEVLPWRSKNIEQHAAFQAMWLQYDHIMPHARGGNNDLENIIITCAPCNYGRCDSLVEEVGVLDPRERDPISSTWDGLERFTS